MRSRIFNIVSTLLTFNLLVPVAAQACTRVIDECVVPPTPISKWSDISQPTVAVFASSPYFPSNSGATMSIQVTPITATEICIQPSYMTYLPFDRVKCSVPFFIPEKTTSGGRITIKASLTSTVYQNGSEVGKVSITTADVPVTKQFITPIVNTTDIFDYVVKVDPFFCSSCSKITSAPLRLTSSTPPIAVLPPTFTAVLGSSVIIDGSQSFNISPSPSIRTYRWDFGDGVKLATTTPLVEHAYQTTVEGTFLVKLTVNDGRLDSNVATVSVAVKKFDWLPILFNQLLD